MMSEVCTEYLVLDSTIRTIPREATSQGRALYVDQGEEVKKASPLLAWMHDYAYEVVKLVRRRTTYVKLAC
jgi:hypothetical protein